MTDVARYSATMLAQFSGRELNAVEELLAKRREAYDENTWFHGGYPGLNFGDVLMPPTTTGYVPMQQMLVDLHMGISSYADLVDPTYSPDYVYLTHNQVLAKDHAAAWSGWNYVQTGKWEKGRVYHCCPQGLIIPYFRK